MGGLAYLSQVLTILRNERRVCDNFLSYLKSIWSREVFELSVQSVKFPSVWHYLTRFHIDPLIDYSFLHTYHSLVEKNSRLGIRRPEINYFPSLGLSSHLQNEDFGLEGP